MTKKENVTKRERERKTAQRESKKRREVKKRRQYQKREREKHLSNIHDVFTFSVYNLCDAFNAQPIAF